MAAAEFVALIMAGGSGTRFWPASRKAVPKQYLKLVGDRSLIQQTVDRLLLLTEAKHLFICSGESQHQLLKQQLPEISNLILEPSGRNTSPCVMLSLAHLLKLGYSDSTVMGVFPADHYIADDKNFQRLVQEAAALARETNGLITLGIQPTSPHTGYGYIEADASQRQGSGYRAKRFVEKPDLATAQKFLAEKTFYWNGGIFLWTLGALRKAFEKFCAEDWTKIQSATPANLASVYSQVAAAPIDKAIMEKAENVYVVPAQMGWSDIGSWNALYELQAESGQDNISATKSCHFEQSHRNLVQAPTHKRVALIGVTDLIVVDTGDTLLVLNRHEDQQVRKMAEALDK